MRALFHCAGWSITWKLTLVYEVPLHLYITRLAYATDGFRAGLVALLMPVLGDQAVSFVLRNL